MWRLMCVWCFLLTKDCDIWRRCVILIHCVQGITLLTFLSLWSANTSLSVAFSLNMLWILLLNWLNNFNLLSSTKLLSRNRNCTLLLNLLYLLLLFFVVANLYSNVQVKFFSGTIWRWLMSSSRWALWWWRCCRFLSCNTWVDFFQCETLRNRIRLMKAQILCKLSHEWSLHWCLSWCRDWFCTCQCVWWSGCNRRWWVNWEQWSLVALNEWGWLMDRLRKLSFGSRWVLILLLHNEFLSDLNLILFEYSLD